MERKDAVLREAEEIVEHFIRKHQENSRNFHRKIKKSKRLNPKGIGLLLSVGASVLLWGLLLWWIF